MFSYPRLGTETRPSVDSMCNAADEPCPIYDSRVGYTNGALHFGDRDDLDLTAEQGEDDDGDFDDSLRITIPDWDEDVLTVEDDVTFWHHRWFDSEKEGDPSENIVGPTRGEGEGGPDLRSTGSG